MSTKSLGRFLAALTFAASGWAAAAPYTLTIEGVDPGTVPVVPLGALLPGMFVGLGDCGQGVSDPCNGLPPIALNPLATAQDVIDANTLDGTNFSNAAIYGYGFALDQLIFHSYSKTFDFTGGVLDLTAFDPGSLQQDFDFVVGNTGGGSFGFTNNVEVTRNIRITGPGGFDTGLIAIAQFADITVGDEDTLTILQTPFTTISLPDGNLQFRFLAEGPITAGDPAVPGELIAAVPVPTTLALVGLGLLGFARRGYNRRA